MCIGVSGVLVSLLMCGVQKARDAAARAACANNLKQTALALHQYYDAYDGLPPRPSVAVPNATLSWMGFILPYIEQDALWAATVEAFVAEPRYAFQVTPHVGYQTVVKTYVCPADGRLLVPITDGFGVTAAYTSYIGIGGSTRPNGVFGAWGVRFADVTDGLSQTVMVGERPPPQTLKAGRWYTASQDAVWGLDRGPDVAMLVETAAWVTDGSCAGPMYSFGYGRLDNPCDRYHLWSLHPGGANFAFADGGVRFLSYSAADILPALATCAGGEVVALPD